MTPDLWAAVASAFDGARLKQARELAGLKRYELATAAEVSPAAIGQFESAIARPSPTTVAALVVALDVMPSFFVVGRPIPGLPPGGAHFRSLRRTRVAERQRALALVQLVCEAAQHLTRHVELPAVELPRSAESGAHLSPESAAALVREVWALGDGPVPHLVRQLEAHGVLVAWPNFDGSGDVDAFSTQASGRPVVVMTGDRDDVFRFRYAAAHELGHLLLHSDPEPGNRAREDEAEEFAAHFLMPTEPMLRALPRRLDLRELSRLRDAWGVSVEALLIRSGELGVLPDASIQRGFRLLSGLRGSGGLRPAPILQFPGETPALFARALEVAEESGMTLGRLAGDVGLSEFRLRSILGLEARPRLRLVVG